MMKLKGSESGAEKPGAARFTKRLPMVMLALGATFAPYPGNEACMLPLSYETAKACPERRQEYLDFKAALWRNECVSEIIYDQHGEEPSRRYLRDLLKHGLSLEPQSKIDGAFTCDKASAHVTAPRELIGRGDHVDIFVCGNAFLGTEGELGDIISVYETTHACDRHHGIRAGGRTYGFRELAGIFEQTVAAVMEVRAYGNSVRHKPGRYYDDFGLGYFARYLMNEVAKVDAEVGQRTSGRWKAEREMLESVLSKADAGGTPAQYLIRHTLAA